MDCDDLEEQACDAIDRGNLDMALGLLEKDPTFNIFIPNCEEWVVGKVYKDKKSSGCALCKAHKHGWQPKKKERDRFMEKMARKEIQEFLYK